MAETHLCKQLFNSQFQPKNPLLLSWEEKAFAEDTSGQLGGSVWPPRSYSCNFCMRQFRSAQALGGHMNVHRRDRARLQHSFVISSHIGKISDDIRASNIINKVKANSSAVESTPHAAEKTGEGAVSGHGEKSSVVETELSMNSFVTLQNRPSGFCGNQVFKRPKISISSLSFCESYSSSSSSTEELDLELRLAS